MKANLRHYFATAINDAIVLDNESTNGTVQLPLLSSAFSVARAGSGSPSPPTVATRSWLPGAVRATMS
jgi:hypothetical protein